MATDQPSTEVTRSHGITMRGGSRRRLVLLAAAIVVALIVIAQARSGSSAGPVADRGPASTASPRNHLTATTTGRAAATSAPSSTSTTVAPPLFTHKTGTILVLGGGSRLSVANLDANSLRFLDLPAGVFANGGNFGQGPGSIANLLVARQRSVVLQAGDQTMAISIDLLRPPVVLGRTVAFFPSLRPDRVWLLALGAAGPTVREVDLTGHATSPLVALPTDWVPQAAVENGLLLSNGLSFEVWDPFRASVVRQGPQFAQIMASNNRMVVWISTFGCQVLCAVHISNLVTGTDRAVFVQNGNISSGAFSPDGRQLALGLNPGGVPSAPGGLLLVDTSTYSTKLVSISAAASSEIVWAPSGQWIFFASNGGSTLVEGYRLGAADAEIVLLPTTVSGSTIAAF